MKASLKLLNLDVQGQLDVLRPFLLVQLHFFLLSCQEDISVTIK